MSERNPTFIPGKLQSGPSGCPKCGSMEWMGRRIGGASVIKTCSSCRNSWGGGLDQYPEDPKTPRPPEILGPGVHLARGEQKGTVIEILVPESKLPDFKRGTPILEQDGEGDE